MPKIKISILQILVPTCLVLIGYVNIALKCFDPALLVQNFAGFALFIPFKSSKKLHHYRFLCLHVNQVWFGAWYVQKALQHNFACALVGIFKRISGIFPALI